MKTIIISLYFFIKFNVLCSAQLLDTSLQQQSYIFPEFINGSVLSKSGEVNYAPLNYCSYDQSIVFKSSDKLMILVGLEQIDTIYIADKKFIPVSNTIYEVMPTAGKIGLLINYKSKLVPWTASADHSGSVTDKNGAVSNTMSSVYINKPYKGDFSIQIIKHYWLKDYNNIYKANSLHDFIKVFKESTNPSIEEYVRQNHIDFKNENDLIKLVNFCNSK